MLAKHKRLFQKTPLGRVKLISDKNHYIIALIIKERVSEIIQRQVVTEAISALLSIIDEISIDAVPYSKSDIDKVSWQKIRDILDDTFRNRSQDLDSTNRISTLPLSDCARILNNSRGIP